MDLPEGIIAEDLKPWTPDEQAIYYIWGIASEVIQTYGPFSQEFSDISLLLITTKEAALMRKNIGIGEDPLLGINLVEEREYNLVDFLPTYKTAKRIRQEYALQEKDTDSLDKWQREIEEDSRFQ